MDYQQIYKEAMEKREMIAIDNKKLLWIEAVLDKKKEDQKVLFSEMCEMEYTVKRLEKITVDNLLKRLKGKYQGLYERAYAGMKLVKAKYDELIAEIEDLKQERSKTGSHMRQAKRDLEKLQQELKKYPEAEAILKEQEKQKEMLSHREEELKREIAFAEGRIVLAEETKKGLMEEARDAKVYDMLDDDEVIADIIRGGLKAVCTGTPTIDLKNVLNSNHDQLRDNIVQQERDVYSLTYQLSALKDELKEIESKLEEYT